MTSSNDVPAEAPRFETTSIKEAVTLVCHGHTDCTVYANLAGECDFSFVNSPDLQRDLKRIRDGKSRVEPGLFMKHWKSMRRAMDDSTAKVRAAAENDPDAKTFLWHEREAARRAATEAPSPWTKIRQQQAAAESAALKKWQQGRPADVAGRWEWERATKPPPADLRDGDVSGSNQLFFGGKD